MTCEVEILWFADNNGVVTVGGYRLPYITAVKMPSRDGRVWVHLQIDGRFSIDAPMSAAEEWLPWVANAMAVAAGYSCFGENCVELNPFKRRMIGLDNVPPVHSPESN